MSFEEKTEVQTPDFQHFRFKGTLIDSNDLLCDIYQGIFKKK